jgi:hypothetical protein
MAFIGTPLDTRNTFQSLAGKRFDGDGSTTAFTLDVAPSSTLDIEVFVGNVRQDPNSAYTLSGTTLTFTGAPPSGTNNIYVVHQAKSVGTIDPPAVETVAKQFNGGVVFNEDSADVDFRVESNGNANMLVVNGGEDKVGIGADPDLGAALHIKTADSSASANAAADELVIEGSANSGISILSGNSSAGRIYFSDSGDDDIGQIRYNHDDNSMNFKVNALADSLKIDSAGHVTMPLQSAFSAQCNAELSNVPNDNSVQTVKLGTEIFDLNADYNTSTFTFTAPVTGKYLLTFSATLANVDSDATYIAIFIDTSNRNYQDSNTFGINGYGADEPRVEVSQTVVADMDASDTAKVSIKQFQGTAQMDVQDDTCHFSGHLVC